VLVPSQDQCEDAAAAALHFNGGRRRRIMILNIKKKINILIKSKQNRS
jgi:hypothetical protein